MVLKIQIERQKFEVRNVVETEYIAQYFRGLRSLVPLCNLIRTTQRILKENLIKIQEGVITRKKQDKLDFIEDWPKRTPEDGKIDWSRSAEEITERFMKSLLPR